MKKGKQWKKRIAGILLALAMVIGSLAGLVPGTVMTVRAADFIYVGTEKAPIATGGDGANWSYNADTHTLTLSGVDISSGSAESGYEYCGIYYNETAELKIVLEGTNTINLSAVDNSKGIYADCANVSISGTGTLEITTKGNGIEGAAITISSGKVTTTSTGNNSVGIEATNGFTVSGGDVTATSTGTGFTGIKATNGFTVSGGDVTATSTGAGFTGIYAPSGVTINGGTVDVTGTGENSQGIDTSSVMITAGTLNATGTWRGISSTGVTVDGGTLNATGTGTGNPGIVCFQDGFTIKNGNATVVGTTMGIMGTVKNSIPGTGWKDTAGTEGKADIAINTDGASLDDYKRLRFIAPKTYVVTFKVENGSWDDGKTTDKTVTLEGQAPLKLAADQIPAVGSKPATGYKAGAWNKVPSTGTEITEATTFIYSYAKSNAATVVTPPAAKSGLAATGSAQELVTAGKADNGTMQYALGKDASTAPTEGWSADIPKGTDAKTYYVWYMAKGDKGYTDSKAECVKVTIAEKSSNIEFIPSETGKSESEGEAPASAQGEGLDELLTEEDKAAGATYEMTIEPKTFESVRSNGGEQIQEKARDHYTSVSTEETKVKEVYLDMSIFKKTGSKSEAVHSTGKAIHVWFPYNLKGRHFPMFWRYHEGAVTPFANNKSGEDGTFYVENEGTENAVVHTFSKEFSTYALTYVEGPVEYRSSEGKKQEETHTSNISYSGSSSSGGSDGPMSVGGIISGGQLGGQGASGRTLTETQLPAGMSRKVLYGKGSVLLSVKAATANGALLGDSAQILSACLTPEELAAVEAGATAELSLNITGASVADSVKQTFAAAYPTLTFGEFFDISIEKKVGKADRTKVAKTSSALTILLDIRKDLQAAGRSFSVVRDHEGVLTKLVDADADAATVTIATDGFSTYALAYETAEGTLAAGTKSNGKMTVSPKTEDMRTDARPMLAVYAIALLAGMALLIMKKRNG